MRGPRGAFALDPSTAIARYPAAGPAAAAAAESIIVERTVKEIAMVAAGSGVTPMMQVWLHVYT
jgi:hypothetical protein